MPSAPAAQHSGKRMRATTEERSPAKMRPLLENWLLAPGRRRSQRHRRAGMQLKAPAQLFFAATIIAIGVIGLIGGTFASIWQPVPDTMPARQLLSYLCTFVSLTCGAGLLIKRTGAPAALVLF